MMMLETFCRFRLNPRMTALLMPTIVVLEPTLTNTRARWLLRSAGGRLQRPGRLVVIPQTRRVLVAVRLEAVLRVLVVGTVSGWLASSTLARTCR